ncbi:MAG: hypothetical protein HY399_04805 [Elusimicrobia bacterium]|nr:hypothetical protein [Elusimicrobiota bacterium]
MIWKMVGPVMSLPSGVGSALRPASGPRRAACDKRGSGQPRLVKSPATHRFLAFFFTLSFILYPSYFLFAGVSLQKVEWQVGASRKPPRQFSVIREWKQGPSDKAPGKVRIVLSIVNTSSSAVEGVLVRYALSAKLAPLRGEKSAGAWVVPFWLEESRVPWLAALQTKNILLTRMDLQVFFKRMKRLGYWPEAIKIQVMIEPKMGESLQDHILESELPIVSP